MVEAEATTEASLSAINETLMRISATLGRMAARQDQMLVDSKKMTAALAPMVATRPMLVPGRVLEQPEIKRSSPSLVSMHQVVAAGDLRVDGVVTPTVPTRCSILGLPVNFCNNKAAVAFPTSGTTRLPPATLTGVSNSNGMLQGAGGSILGTPIGCSAPVLNYPPYDLGAHAPGVDSDMPRGPSCQVEEHPADQCPLHPQTSFPRFNGDNPRLWRAKCLKFFKSFNIPECMWVTAARLHMEGSAADWFRTHRLCQPFDDWSQFMNAVEAYFVVGDSETPDTVEKQLSCCEASVEGVTQMPETTAAGYEDVLTNVEGVSLILEPFAQYAEVVFSELHSMEPEYEVFPTAGGLSQFLEEGLGSTAEVCDAVLFEDVSGPGEVLTHVGGVSLFLDLSLCSAERLTERPFKHITKVVDDQMLTEVRGLSVFTESALDSHRGHDRIIDTTIPTEEGKQEAVIKALFGLQPHAGRCARQCNFCVINRSRKDTKAMHLATYHLLNKMPSWRRSGFSPGYYLQTRLGVAPSSNREICMLAMHWHNTTLQIQLRGSLVQLQPHALYHSLRGRQEIGRLQADLHSNLSYSACTLLNWIIVHIKRLPCSITFSTAMACRPIFTYHGTSTWSCGQVMERVAGTLYWEVHTAFYWTILGEYIIKENLHCTRLWQDLLVKGRLHFAEVCEILLRPWDPGVHDIRPGFAMANQVWKWLSVMDWRRRYEQAIAWGQAMFPGAGSVTPAQGQPMAKAQGDQAQCIQMCGHDIVWRRMPAGSIYTGGSAHETTSNRTGEKEQN